MPEVGEKAEPGQETSFIIIKIIEKDFSMSIGILISQ